MNMNKTFSQRKEDAVHNWMLADAKDQILGRFATKVASILKGKHKPTFTPPHRWR
jgi:large subunit ribosomal protein L13